jgi:hypothetical protein
VFDNHSDIVGSLAAAPDVLDALLDGVDGELARSARGGDEGWSVVEVVCHLRDAEERAVQRVGVMRDEEEPVLHGYDQDALAIERNYAGSSLPDAVSAYKRLRAEQVAALRALSAEGWDRAGIHDDVGRVTIENYEVHMASHDVQHFGQIARALRDARAGATGG